MTAAYEIGTELSGSKADPSSPSGADPGGQPASYSEPDGDPAMRLIEAGYALHRAAVALEGMGPGTLAQSWTRYRQTPYGETPSPLDARAGSMSVLDDVNSAMAHVDNVNDAIAVAATELGLASTLVHPHKTRSELVGEVVLVASPTAGPLPDALKRVGDDLDRSTLRGIFEIALILKGTLEHDCVPEVAREIEAAIELLDETIQETRMVVFGLQNAEDSSHDTSQEESVLCSALVHPVREPGTLRGRGLRDLVPSPPNSHVA